MQKFFRILLVTTAFAIIVPTTTAAYDLPSFPYLLVEGKSELEVRPDKATLQVYVSAFDAKSDVASETVQQQIIALLAILAKHSIPDDAITSYNLVKEVERAREDRIETVILGYHLSRRLSIELVDISKFAELVAELARLDNVSSLNADFDISNRDSVELELMNEAGADARRIAENMVHGMSRTVGPVYGISESSVRSTAGLFDIAISADYPKAMIRRDMSYRETVFVPSTIKLRQSIHVVFQLE